MRLFVLACAGLLSALALPARAQQASPPARRALVINDPFAAPLWRIDVDAGENRLVAGSPAKAAAVWSFDDVLAPELIRLPLRDEEMQRAHAIAISPDGKRIAAAVPPLRDERGFAKAGTAVIYILERASRRIEMAITKDVATRPQALRFSPDGTLLAATLSDGCGLRVWRTGDWSLAGSDDAGYGGASGTCCPATSGTDCDPFPDTPGLVWANPANGEPLLVTSGDTGVRLYKASGAGISLVTSKSPADIGLERPEGVAVSPDGTRLAIGDARIRGASPVVKLQVAVLELQTLTPAGPPLSVPNSALVLPAMLDTKLTPGADQMALNRVTWMSGEEGDTIYAGGVTWCQIADPSLVLGTQEGEGTENCIVRWRLPASGAEKSADVHFIRAGLDRVMDLAPLPKRKALAYATLQRVGALNDDGTPYANDAGAEIFAAARAFDFRDRPVDRAKGTMLGFDISPDASTIYLEDYRTGAAAPIALTFNVDRLELKRADTPDPAVSLPKRDPLIIDKLANWWNSPKPPVIYGLSLDALQGVRDTYRTVVLAPNKRAIVGSATHIRVVGYDGGKAEVLCQLRVAAEAYRAAVSDDGSLAVVGHSDGTLRWYRIERGEEGAGCKLTQLLAVHIRQADGEDGTWTWAAWLPGTGQFAADPRAKDLVGWQVDTADGQVQTVRFADVLQHYAPDAVKAALRQLIAPTLDVVASLEKSIGDAADPLRLLVLTPDENADVTSEVVKFDIKADGGTTWPRKLYVATGSGARVAKVSGGKDLAANEPIEIAAPGIVQMQVKLPAAERLQHRNVDVCFLVDRQRDCHTITWAGALEKPRPRALRAVIVGLSAYKDPTLALNFAQNDALDLARIFVRDYKARVVDKTSKVPADFATVSIDLLVAAGSASAKADLAELQTSGIVNVHEATVANIAAVLGKLAQQGTNENDLVLFYFSGHGMLNPYRDAKGLTALLGPNVDASYTRESLERDALTSDRLIALLEPIAGEKLVIIDACRTAASIAGERAFDPAAIRLEFEKNLLTADFFFSAAPGQYSLDQGELAFSDARPQEESGNGLFTYALLKSLTDTGNAPSGAKPRKVEVYDVDRYVRGFFDGQDEDSAAVRLIRRLQEQGVAVALQQPVFVPARRRVASATVIRTLEPAP